MLLVGLTGGIGTGKSTVATLLRERGAVVVDGDRIARELQAPGSPLLAAMAERFGAGIICADGSLDRAAVAALVFGDSDEATANRADLNRITHPAIRAEVEAQIAAHAGTDAIVVLDQPLLTPRPDLQAFVVVDVPPDEAVRRLVEFRGMAEHDARARIASQVSRDERLGWATHVVDNAGDPAALADAVDELWEALVALNQPAG